MFLASRNQDSETIEFHARLFLVVSSSNDGERRVCDTGKLLREASREWRDQMRCHVCGRSDYNRLRSERIRATLPHHANLEFAPVSSARARDYFNAGICLGLVTEFRGDRLRQGA